MTVVPVIAAVTAAVWIFVPPDPFGTRSRIAPLFRSTVREPSLKLKIVFAPNRAIVRSPKVNSARDSTPVRTAVSPRMVSLVVAGRGSARAGRIFTSLTTCVTRASFRTPPLLWPFKDRMLAARQPIAAPANIRRFFIGLEFEGQRKRAPDVCHVVIKHALARLAPGERAGRARRKVFGDPIIRGQGDDLAHIRAVDAAIIANKNPANRSQGKRPRDAHGVAEVNVEFIALRRRGACTQADVGVGA